MLLSRSLEEDTFLFAVYLITLVFVNKRTRENLPWEKSAMVNKTQRAMPCFTGLRQWKRKMNQVVHSSLPSPICIQFYFSTVHETVHEMKATEQYFPVVLSIMLYKVVLTFEYVDKILKCEHSNESY